jgi:hypothetical protein
VSLFSRSTVSGTFEFIICKIRCSSVVFYKSIQYFCNPRRHYIPYPCLLFEVGSFFIYVVPVEPNLLDSGDNNVENSGIFQMSIVL